MPHGMEESGPSHLRAGANYTKDKWAICDGMKLTVGCSAGVVLELHTRSVVQVVQLLWCLVGGGAAVLRLG